jgi:hypothetical protein
MHGPTATKARTPGRLPSSHRPPGSLRTLRLDAASAHDPAIRRELGLCPLDRRGHTRENHRKSLQQLLDEFADRRIFSRFEKLDVLFLGFLNFALIIEALR